MEIMIEKNGIVGIIAQQLLSLRHVVGNIQVIALKALAEPVLPSSVVFEQKNPNRVAIRGNFAEPKFAH
jgi:hypothetical protein